MFEDKNFEPTILVISTNSCSYPGIDNAGQIHKEYPASTYVVAVPDPILFPIDFYVRVFRMGYDGILIASCGTDSPYKKTYEKLAARFDELIQVLKSEHIDYARVKLTAVCTVCAEHFVRELMQLYDKIEPLGPVGGMTIETRM